MTNARLKALAAQLRERREAELGRGLHMTELLWLVAAALRELNAAVARDAALYAVSELLGDEVVALANAEPDVTVERIAYWLHCTVDQAERVVDRLVREGRLAYADPPALG